MTTAFTFHSRRQAATALAAGHEAGAPILLVTAPGAAAHAGPEFLLEIYRTAKADVPDAQGDVLIDCGTDVGTAMRALRSGWRQMIFAGDDTVRGKIIDMAEQMDCVVHDARPETTDLNDAGDPAWACRQAIALGH